MSTDTATRDTSGGVYNLTRAIISREITLFFRYPVNVIGQLVAFIAIFGVIVFGGQAIAGEAISNSLEGIIVGYFLWMLAINSFSSIATEMRAEANWGTLERLALTPFGFGNIMLVKSFAKLLISFVTSSVVLISMMLLTGTVLHVDVVTIVPILVLTVASAFGCGFAIGGLTVLYKNVQSLTMLLQLVFIGLIGAPAFNQGLLTYLPLVQGSALLQRAMQEGVRIWEFAAFDLFVLCLTGVGYLGVGFLFFQLCQRRARRLGVLGDY